MNDAKQEDLTYEVFQRIYDFIPANRVATLRAAFEGKIEEQPVINEVGPGNYHRWKRDIDVISETLWVLQHEKKIVLA